MGLIYSSIIFIVSTVSILTVGVLLYSMSDGKFDLKVENPNMATLTSLTGFFLGISFIVINAFYGVSENGLLKELYTIMIYIGLGSAMLILSKFIFNKIVMKQFNVYDRLKSGNVGIGILDGSNFVATGFIVFSVLYWFDLNTLHGIELTSLLYITSMIMLTIYGLVYNKTKENYEDNINLAIERGVGRISFAFSMGIAFSISRGFAQDNAIILIFMWIGLSLLTYFVITALSKIVSFIVFNKSDKNYIVSSSVIKLAIILPSPFFFM